MKKLIFSLAIVACGAGIVFAASQQKTATKLNANCQAAAVATCCEKADSLGTCPKFDGKHHCDSVAATSCGQHQPAQKKQGCH